MHISSWLQLVFSLAVIIFLFPVTKAFSAEPAPTLLASAASPEEVMLFQEIPSVYSASKYEQKVTEAPSSVSIVTSSDIKKYGYRTLGDILRGMRSFFVTYDRNYTYVGVRGFGRPADYNNRVLLLIDGHRTNDTLYDMAFIGTEGILDADLIDRVEVVRGPGSSLYGSNALLAVINIITKRGRDLKGAEVSGEAGSYDTYKTRVSYGERFKNGLEIIGSASLYDSRGQSSLYFREFDPAIFPAEPRAANGGITNQKDYDKFHSFFTKASLNDFTFEAAYSSRTKGIPTASFGADFDAPNKTRDTRGYLDLRYDKRLPGQVDFAARIFYDYYRYMGDYIYSGTTNKDRGYGEWWGGELKFSTRILDFMRLIVGAEYTYNNRLDQQNYDVASPPVSHLDDKRRSEIWGLYLQDEFTLAKNLLLNAGLRYDHYDNFDRANPRLALIYTPFAKSAFKALYGTAYRAPSPFELYYQSPTNAPNPALKPETIDTYELVYEQYIANHFRVTAGAFYYIMNDLINQVDAGGGMTMFRNLDKVESHGFELELENKWTNGIEGRFSYTLQKTVNSATHATISNSPEHLLKFNLILPVWKNRIFAGIEEQYMSRRKTIMGNYTSDAAITNITLFSQSIVKGLEFSASIYNLFDRKYSDPVSADFSPVTTVQQDGRSYRFKLTYAF